MLRKTRHKLLNTKAVQSMVSAMLNVFSSEVHTAAKTSSSNPSGGGWQRFALFLHVVRVKLRRWPDDNDNMIVSMIKRLDLQTDKQNPVFTALTAVTV